MLLRIEGYIQNYKYAEKILCLLRETGVLAVVKAIM
jgi:hypothetical protein